MTTLRMQRQANRFDAAERVKRLQRASRSSVRWSQNCIISCSSTVARHENGMAEQREAGRPIRFSEAVAD